MALFEKKSWNKKGGNVERNSFFFLELSVIDEWNLIFASTEKRVTTLILKY